MRNAPQSLACLCAALGLAGPARADDFSGYLTLTSDYVFRGVSHSNTNPTVYGGLDYAHQSGAFAGLFTAVLDYPYAAFDAQAELDLFIGFSRPAGRDFEWDVALIHYQYFESSFPNDDYQELAFNMHYRDLARLGLAASNDAARGGADGWVAELELRQPFAERFLASGTLGRYTLSHERWRSYTYWDLGVSAVFEPVTVDLRYYDTSDDAIALAGERLTEGRVVASVSIGF